ncbi:hypothetical protein VPHK571_0220 [Vibrio phage K571]
MKLHTSKSTSYSHKKRIISHLYSYFPGDLRTRVHI